MGNPIKQTYIVTISHGSTQYKAGDLTETKETHLFDEMFNVKTY